LSRFLKGFGEDEAEEIYLLSSAILGPIGRTGDVRRRFNLDVHRPGVTNAIMLEYIERMFLGTKLSPAPLTCEWP
jgi:hypothetical protein